MAHQKFSAAQAQAGLSPLEEAASFLNRVPAWYLATVDVEDAAQPHVRPFSFAAADQGKLWFSTSYDKDVWAELTAHPKFELSAWKPGECWLVLKAEANLADDQSVSEEVRQAAYKHMEGLGEHHESAHDNRLAFFTAKNAEARYCEIDGTERVATF